MSLARNTLKESLVSATFLFVNISSDQSAVPVILSAKEDELSCYPSAEKTDIPEFHIPFSVMSNVKLDIDSNGLSYLRLYCKNFSCYYFQILGSHKRDRVQSVIQQIRSMIDEKPCIIRPIPEDFPYKKFMYDPMEELNRLGIGKKEGNESEKLAVVWKREESQYPLFGSACTKYYVNRGFEKMANMSRIWKNNDLLLGK